MKEIEKEKKQLEDKIKELEARLAKKEELSTHDWKLVEAIWPNKFRDKSTENCFIDEDEEKFHKYIGKIGEEATSITYKVVDTRTGAVMCKKVLKVDPTNPPSIQDVKNIIKEIEVLVRINHPCICNSLFINTYEVVKDSNVLVRILFIKQNWSTLDSSEFTNACQNIHSLRTQ